MPSHPPESSGNLQKHLRPAYCIHLGGLAAGGGGRKFCKTIRYGAYVLPLPSPSILPRQVLSGVMGEDGRSGEEGGLTLLAVGAFAFLALAGVVRAGAGAS
jgi:hypothetical protein